jgi:5'-nucleotidase
MVKSGCDYRNLSHIVIEEGASLTEEEQKNVPSEPINDDNVQTGFDYFYQIKDGKFKVKIQRYDVTKAIEPNAHIKSEVDNYYKDLDKEMKITNCHLDEAVDTAFSSVRSEENPIGNFICDLMKKEHSADIAILNSGNIRADKLYPKGFMKVGDWYDLIPFTVPIVKIECTGLMIKNACEVCVSKYPALEGRFLQTSNLFFKFDPTKETGNRINIEDIRIGDKQLDPEETYTPLVTTLLLERMVMTASLVLESLLITKMLHY